VYLSGDLIDWEGHLPCGRVQPEVQRCGVHEHHGELAEQVAPAGKQLLLDENVYRRAESKKPASPLINMGGNAATPFVLVAV
jgi:hypothetical protein